MSPFPPLTPTLTPHCWAQGGDSPPHFLPPTEGERGMTQGARLARILEAWDRHPWTGNPSGSHVSLDLKYHETALKA